MQVNNSLYEFDRAGQWVRNPNFEQGAQAISNNFRVMGQLGGFPEHLFGLQRIDQYIESVVQHLFR